MPDGNNLFKENKTLRDFSINLAWQLLSVFRFREIHSASGHRTNTRGKSKRRQINYQYKKNTHKHPRDGGWGGGSKPEGLRWTHQPLRRTPFHCAGGTSQ